MLTAPLNGISHMLIQSFGSCSGSFRAGADANGFLHEAASLQSNSLSNNKQARETIFSLCAVWSERGVHLACLPVGLIIPFASGTHSGT